MGEAGPIGKVSTTPAYLIGEYGGGGSREKGDGGGGDGG